MAQEYSEQVPVAFGRRFPNVNRYQHQDVQPPSVQWTPYVPEVPATVYPQTYWSSERVYSQQPDDAAYEFPAQPDYPESSQRTILSPSPQTHQCRNDHSRSMSLSPNFAGKPWPCDSVYALDALSIASPPSRHAAHRPESTAPIAPAPPALPALPAPSPPQAPPSYPQSGRKCKVESLEDAKVGCFVMEPFAEGARPGLFCHPLPMEVPLRATGASKEMRKLMNVFRLNPFALQNGDGKRGGSLSSESSSASSSCSSESSPQLPAARPLEEEPLMFEFQLRLGDHSDLPVQDAEGKRAAGLMVDSPAMDPALLPELERMGLDEAENLHTFAADFELHEDDGGWGTRMYTPPTSAALSVHSWDGDVDSSDGGRHSAASHRSSGLERLHATASHPYLRKSRQVESYYPQAQASPSPLHSGSTAANHVYQSFPQSMQQQQQYHPSSMRMRAHSPYVEDHPQGSATTSAIKHPSPQRNVSIDNSMIYSQNLEQAEMRYGGEDTIAGAALNAAHRRWSMPETCGPSANLGFAQPHLL